MVKPPFLIVNHHFWWLKPPFLELLNSPRYPPPMVQSVHLSVSCHRLAAAAVTQKTTEETGGAAGFHEWEVDYNLYTCMCIYIYVRVCVWHDDRVLPFLLYSGYEDRMIICCSSLPPREPWGPAWSSFGAWVSDLGSNCIVTHRFPCKFPLESTKDRIAYRMDFYLDGLCCSEW